MIVLYMETIRKAAHFEWLSCCPRTKNILKLVLRSHCLVIEFSHRKKKVITV